jgi:hypothetical protein
MLSNLLQMKKLLFVLLLTISSIVYAEYSSIGTTDEAEWFINLNTIQQFGQYKRVWTKSEMFTTSSFFKQYNNRSISRYEEFDCREKKYRRLATRYFFQPDLNGIDNIDNEIKEWVFIAPNTPPDKLLNILCKK